MIPKKNGVRSFLLTQIKAVLFYSSLVITPCVSIVAASSDLPAKDRGLAASQECATLHKVRYFNKGKAQ